MKQQMSHGKVTVGRLSGIKLTQEQWEALAIDVRARILQRDADRNAGKESVYGGRWHKSDLSQNAIARRHGISRRYVGNVEDLLRRDPAAAFRPRGMVAVERGEHGRIVRHVPLVLAADPAAGRPKELVIGSDKARGLTDPLSVFARSSLLKRRW